MSARRVAGCSSMGACDDCGEQKPIGRPDGRAECRNCGYVFPKGAFEP